MLSMDLNLLCLKSTKLVVIFFNNFPLKVWSYHYICTHEFCGYGEIGRRARLRIWCRKACRFESYYPHFYKPLVRSDRRFRGFFILSIPCYFLKRSLQVSENRKIKIGIKEATGLIDFVTVKTFEFPWIVFVWLGLIIMALGMQMSMLHRIEMKNLYKGISLFVSAVVLFYLFLLAN